MTLNTTSKTFVGVAAGTVKNLNFNNLPFLTTKQIAGSIVNIYFNNNTYNGFTVTSNTFAVASSGLAVGLARIMPLVTNPPPPAYY